MLTSTSVEAGGGGAAQTAGDVGEVEAGKRLPVRLGELEGDAVVYQVVQWNEGEFEIDFGSSSDRTTTTRSTTGLLMEAMRLIDEASSDRVER